MMPMWTKRLNARTTLWLGSKFSETGAGGYGDPLERDPELVRHRVREGWTFFAEGARICCSK